MLSDFSEVANRIAATTKKSEKERLLAAFLAGLDDSSLERAAVFFSGSPFARKDQRVTGVGGSTIADAILAVAGRTAAELSAAWSRHADLGDAAAELFETASANSIPLAELGAFFDRLAITAGAIEKRGVVAELLARLDAQSVRYVVKILLNEFRIGLQEGLVEAAIARAFGRALGDVRRANMLTGDIGATALLARADALASARMTLFHPFAFMLAQPEEDPAAIVASLGPDALADDKYDGIRAQVHSDGSEVRIYSRTLDDVTTRFPEVASAALALQHPVVLDGEIVAFENRILPFAIIQKRLGRRKITEALLRDAPVVFFAFDLLFSDGVVLLETPLRERLAQLRALLANAPASAASIRPSDQTPVRDTAHVDELFDAARARANEGLVIKGADSTYTPGRRGKSWLKYKKALATLDCVVTAAEYGHGKRRSVLSDYTFAVRRQDELVNIGKAYSGLTDVEIERLTAHFLSTTTATFGPVHTVEPTVVLEIAFDRIQESSRHKSRYALRFPRIARIRDDKTVDQVSTIEEVQKIYEGQLAREGGAATGRHPSSTPSS